MTLVIRSTNNLNMNLKKLSLYYLSHLTSTDLNIIWITECAVIGRSHGELCRFKAIQLRWIEISWDEVRYVISGYENQVPECFLSPLPNSEQSAPHTSNNAIGNDRVKTASEIICIHYCTLLCRQHKLNELSKAPLVWLCVHCRSQISYSTFNSTDCSLQHTETHDETWTWHTLYKTEICTDTLIPQVRTMGHHAIDFTLAGMRGYTRLRMQV